MRMIAGVRMSDLTPWPAEGDLGSLTVAIHPEVINSAWFAKMRAVVLGGDPKISQDGG
jgi:hypothetical protein